MGPRLSHNQSVTRLEDLPHEIFYIIFNYLNNDECYRSFAELNVHLNMLVQSHCGSHLCLQATTNSRATNNNHAMSRNIISLTQSSGALCSLTIDYLTENYIQQMYTLVHLKHLRILEIPEKVTYKLCQFLQSSTQIQHLSLPNWCFIGSSLHLPSLHSLHLSRETNQNELVYLMDSLPNVICLLLYCDYMQIRGTIDYPRENGFLGIRYFQLHLSNQTAYELPSIYLNHMPNLRRFIFSTTSSRILISQTDFYDLLNRLATIIETGLLKLRYFSCLITCKLNSNDAFDITNARPIFTQQYSIKFENNTQEFRSPKTSAMQHCFINRNVERIHMTTISSMLR